MEMSERELRELVCRTAEKIDQEDPPRGARLLLKATAAYLANCGIDLAQLLAIAIEGDRTSCLQHAQAAHELNTRLALENMAEWRNLN